MSKRITRRRVLATGAAAGAVALTKPARAGFGPLASFRGVASASPSFVSNEGFVNDSSSAVSANTPSPVFGLVFAIGDIPAGQAPIITVNGVVQQYSHGLQSFWPDGSLKRVSILLAASTMPGIAGSGTATRVITGGGTWPAQGSGTAGLNRSLTEVYNQQLTINALTPVAPYVASSNLNARAVDLHSWLWPSSDPNIYRISKWLDGPAGAAWKISTNLAQTHGGTADGQLLCDHYIIALDDASHALGGFRWLGVLRSPFYKTVNTSAAFFWFQPPSPSSPSSGINWSIQPGGSGSPTYTPHSIATTLQPKTFNWSGSVITTTTPHGWYSGGDGGGGANYFPAILTSGGTLPTTGTTPECVQSSLANGGLVWVQVNASSNTTAQLNTSSTNVFGTSYNITNSGAGATLTPIVGFMMSSTIAFASPDATYNFFQGSGSLTADTTLRPTLDQVYWRSCGGLQPFKSTYQGVAKGGTVQDVAYSYNWNPYNAGLNRTTNVDGGGPPAELGPASGSATCEYYNQSAISFKLTRIHGFLLLGNAWDTKDNAGGVYDRPVNLADPANSYTGLPASVATTIALGSNANYSPASGLSGTTIGVADPSHEPDFACWAFLRTGELQFLDAMVNEACSQNAALVPALRNYTIGSTNYYGVFGAAVDGTRGQGWGGRNIGRTAFLYPFDKSNNSLNTPYLYSDGSQLGKYLNDIHDITCQYNSDFVANANATTYGSTAAANYALANGLWMGVQYQTGTSPKYTFEHWITYEYSYVAISMIYGALRGNAAATSWLKKFVAWVNHIGNSQPWIGNSGPKGGYLILNFIATQSIITIAPIAGSGTDGSYGEPITQDGQFNAYMQWFFSSSKPTLSWVPNSGGGNAFLLTGWVVIGTGSISGNTLTMASQTFNSGFIQNGMVVTGPGIASGTVVTGGSGPYTISGAPQTVGTVAILLYIPPAITYGWTPGNGDVTTIQGYDNFLPIPRPTELSPNIPYIMRDVTTLTDGGISFNLTASGTPSAPGAAITINSAAGVIADNDFPRTSSSAGVIPYNPPTNLVTGSDFVSQGRWPQAWVAALASNARFSAMTGLDATDAAKALNYCNWLAGCPGYNEYNATAPYNADGTTGFPSYLIQPTLA